MFKLSLTINRCLRVIFYNVYQHNYVYVFVKMYSVAFSFVEYYHGVPVCLPQNIIRKKNIFYDKNQWKKGLLVNDSFQRQRETNSKI